MEEAAADLVLWLVGAAYCAAGLQAQGLQPWAIGPFTRPASGNPGDCAAIRSRRLTDPIAEGAGALGGAAHLQPRGDRARWQGLRALSRRGRLGHDGDRHAHVAAGAGGERGRHSFHPARASRCFIRRDDDQKAREWPGGVEDPRIVEAGRRHLRADLHAVEPQDLLGGDCDVDGSGALDQARAGVSAPRRAASMRT